VNEVSPMKRKLLLSPRQFFLVVTCVMWSAAVFAQTDALPSWNDGAAKKAIVDFVLATTAQGSPQFVPPPERIATFDQDGTLWVEHPIYTQVMYVLDACRRWSRSKPELAKVTPLLDRAGAVEGRSRGNGEAHRG
jgi:hypothetical protein